MSLRRTLTNRRGDYLVETALTTPGVLSAEFGLVWNGREIAFLPEEGPGSPFFGAFGVEVRDLTDDRDALVMVNYAGPAEFSAKLVRLRFDESGDYSVIWEIAEGDVFDVPFQTPAGEPLPVDGVGKAAFDSAGKAIVSLSFGDQAPGTVPTFENWAIVSEQEPMLMAGDPAPDGTSWVKGLNVYPGADGNSLFYGKTTEGWTLMNEDGVLAELGEPHPVFTDLQLNFLYVLDYGGGRGALWQAHSSSGVHVMYGLNPLLYLQTATCLGYPIDSMIDASLSPNGRYAAFHFVVHDVFSAIVVLELD